MHFSIAILFFLHIALGSKVNKYSHGKVNALQEILLLNNFTIDREIVLPIEITEKKIVLNGKGAPRVLTVTSPTFDGIYYLGDSIQIDVKFTSAVVVTGVPYLVLNTGCRDSRCKVNEVQEILCKGESGAFGLGFNEEKVYNIPSDASVATFTEYLLRMQQFQKVVVSFDGGNRACSRYGNTIRIEFVTVFGGTDGTFALLTSDAENRGGDGSYLGHGEEASIVVTKVVGGFMPEDRHALYVSQVDGSTLRFTYTVQFGDDVVGLEYASTNALVLPEGAAIQSGTTNANIILPVPRTYGSFVVEKGNSLSSAHAFTVVGRPPFVESISSTETNSEFSAGDVILLQVQFSWSVAVTGLPYLMLEVAPFTRQAIFDSVTGSTVQFRYVVELVDNANPLTLASTTIQLNGGSIHYENVQTETDLPSTIIGGASGQNLLVDNTAPYINKVVATSDNTFAPGDTVQIAIHFTKAVVVAGSPRLMLDTASVDLLSGNFVHTVPTNGNAKQITLPNIDHGLKTENVAGKQFLIGAQVMTGVSVNDNVLLVEEDYVGTAVVFVDIVSGSTPQITIATPGYRYANYESGSLANEIVFAYIVAIGDVSPDLEYNSINALELNSGTIQRHSGTAITNADIFLPTPGAFGSLSYTSNVIIDSTPPAVISVSVNVTDGTYREGEVLAITIEFSLPVDILNMPVLLMDVGQIERYAMYQGGSGTTKIEMHFIVDAVDSSGDLDYDGIHALRDEYGAVAGYIRRSSATPLLGASLTMPLNGISASRSIVLSPNAPYIVSVSSTNSTYSAGDIVSIAIGYSEVVNVVQAGSPSSLQLVAGSMERFAYYASGSGSQILIFQYSVLQGDESLRLSYVSRNSLSLNGGTIRSVGLVDSVLVLPEPHAVNSLSDQSSVVVDTVPPKAVEVSLNNVDYEYDVGDLLDIRVLFDKEITVVGGEPVLTLGFSNSERDSTYKGFDSMSLYFQYTVQAGDFSSRLDYKHERALYCKNEYGINYDGTKHGTSPHLANFDNKLYATWSEIVGAIYQIRVVVFNGNNDAPAWTSVDGGSASAGVNKNSLANAISPLLVSLAQTSDLLYLIWVETSVSLTKSQVRVAQYNGNDVSPSWAFIDYDNLGSGINKNINQDADLPAIAIVNQKLVVGWHEYSGSVYQIRVARYDSAGSTWDFIDGNSATLGLNWDVTQNAMHLSLTAFGSTGLYAVWDEVAGGVSKIRVAAYPGSYWVHIDGKTTSGINVDAAEAASHPSSVLFEDKLYVAWQENLAGVSSIRVKLFSGNLAAPVWNIVDGGGLNRNTALAATQPQLFVDSNALFISWSEIDGSGVAQIRARRYNGVDSASHWEIIDGGADQSRINDNSNYAATQPYGIKMSGDSLAIAWNEVDSSGVSQIRVAQYFEETLFRWPSLTHSCIRRMSATSTTTASIVLAPLGLPGSIGYTHNVVVDTATPSVVRVYGVPKTTSILRLAETIQMLYIYGDSTILTGGYKFTYNDQATACIDWDAAAETGAASVKSIIEDVSSLALQVSITKTAIRNGNRYSVTFTAPILAVAPLGLAYDSCNAFTCTSGSSNCATLTTTPERSLDMNPGLLFVAIEFSKEVIPSGSPTLLLETGTTDQSIPYTDGGLIQIIDIGVRATSRVLHGEYKLTYDGVTTTCINFQDSGNTLRNALKEIPAILRIGIDNIKSEQKGNGYLHTITFSLGNPGTITVASNAGCVPLSGSKQTIDVTAGSAISAGSYKLVYEGSTSNCIQWNAPANGESSMQSALQEMHIFSSLSVNIERNPFQFTNGYRYVVSFGSEDAATAFSVDSTGCTAFDCGGGVCPDESITINADYTISRYYGKTHLFQYVVQAGDASLSLNYVATTSLAGTFTRNTQVPTTTSTLTLPSVENSNSLASFSYKVDTVAAPLVSAVTALDADGTYTAGDVLTITIEFSTAIVVSGQPTLLLNSNTQAKATYVAGNTTTTLSFSYLIATGDASADLGYNSIYSLRLNGGYIQASDRKLDANLVLPGVGIINSLSFSKAIIIDTTAPTITSVTSYHADDTGDGYGVGEIMDIVVIFDKDVAVTGNPFFLLETGAVDSKAIFSLAGRVQYIDIGSITINPILSGEFYVSYESTYSGCIPFNDETVLQSKLLEIQAISDIGIQSVTKTALNRGHRFTISFSTLLVNSAPSEIFVYQPQAGDTCEPLRTGYISDNLKMLAHRSVASALIFRYEVQADDTTSDLDFVDGSIDLNEGTILSQSKKSQVPATLSLPAAGGANSLAINKNLKIVGAIPSIIAITLDSTAGTYGVSSPSTPSPNTVLPGQIQFSTQFSRKVLVHGAPKIELAVGSTRYAEFKSGNLSNTLVFLYTVESGDATNALEFASTSAMLLGDNDKIFGFSTYNNLSVSTTLPVPGIAAQGTVIIDAQSPATINLVTSSNEDGIVGVGSYIRVEVNFSKPVSLQTGLNKDLTWDSRSPASEVLNDKLYIAWIETSGGLSYLHASVYKDAPESYLFIGGSYLNLVGTDSAESPSLATVNSKLYLAWIESGVVHVKVYGGDDNSPSWIKVSGSGINYEISKTAHNLVLRSSASRLFAVWVEPNDDNIEQIRVSMYNGEDSSPQWAFVSGSNAASSLNENPLTSASTPCAVNFKSEFFVAWTETNTIKLAKFVTFSQDWAYVNITAFQNSTYAMNNPTIAENGDILHLSWDITDLSSEESFISYAEFHYVTMAWTSVSTISSQKGASMPRIGVVNNGIKIVWTEYGELSVKSIVLAEKSTEMKGFNYTKYIQHDSNANTMEPYVYAFGQKISLFWAEDDGLSYKLRGSLWKPRFMEYAWDDIVVYGTPRMLMETGGTDVYAYCTEQSGFSGSYVRFGFFVLEGYSSADLEYQSSSALELNDAMFVDINSNSIDLTLFPLAADARSLSHNKALVVNTAAIVVQQVTSTLADGTYGTGQNVTIQVDFSAAVSLFGESSLELDNILSGPSFATYLSGNNTAQLLYTFIVPSTYPTGQLKYLQQNSLTGSAKASSTYPTTVVNMNLPIPGQANSLSILKSIYVDTSTPYVVSCASLSADGTYYLGDTVEIQITFSTPVMVSVPPVMFLNTGQSSPGTAEYVSGNETASLVYSYSIRLGDSTNLLKTLDDNTNGLISGAFANQTILNGNVYGIARLSSKPSTPARLDVPASGQVNSLSVVSTIALDTVRPTVTQIVSTDADGTYDEGDTITINVIFSASVVVSGVPELVLRVHELRTAAASYISGSGTNTLVFAYLVQSGNVIQLLDYADSTSLRLFDPDILYRSIGDGLSEIPSILRKSSMPTLPANLLLPNASALTIASASGMVASNNKISLRADGIRIKNVKYCISNGTYHEGHEICVSVDYTNLVFVSGTPTLLLNANGGSVATYASGSGTSTIVFKYAIIAGDAADPLAYSSPIQLNGGSIFAFDGFNVPLKFTNTNSQNIVIDTSTTTVTHVSGVGDCFNDLCGVGDKIYITVNFSHPVQISGINPTLQLELGATDKLAVYISGDNTLSFMFEYVVEVGDTSISLAYTTTNALSGTLKTLSSAPTTVVDLTLPALGAAESLSSSSIVVDTTEASILLVKSLSPNGTYKAGDTITIAVEFSAPVLPADGITIELNLGANIQTGTYLGGSGTHWLTFFYKFVAGDYTINLDYLSVGSLVGTAQRVGTFLTSQAVNVALPAPSASGSLAYTSNIKVTSDAPYITLAELITNQGVYGVSDTIQFQVVFSEAVTVSGAPTLALSMGYNRVATYISGSGTSTLLFEATVSTNDFAFPIQLDGQFALDEADGIISGNSRATVTLPSPGEYGIFTKSVRIDTSVPKIIQVYTDKPDGMYGVGETIDIFLVFTSAVDVSGSPTLQMETGNTDQYATYTSGSGSSTLVFTYTVQTNDISPNLDYKWICNLEDFSTLHSGYSSQAGDTCSEVNLLSSALSGQILQKSSTISADLQLPKPNAWPYYRYITNNGSVMYLSPQSKSSIVDSFTLNAANANSPSVHQIVLKSSRIIITNGVPSHSTSFTEIKPSLRVFEVNRFPKLSHQRKVSENGIVGIMRNGIPLMNTNLTHTVDSCGGTLSADGNYYYVALPTCMMEAYSSTDAIGYALDGFPIFKPSNSALDSCNGMATSSRNGYRYYLSESTTFFPCLYGLYDHGSNNHLSHIQNLSKLYGISSHQVVSFLATVGKESSATVPWFNDAHVTYTDDKRIIQCSGVPDVSGTYPNAYNLHTILPQNYVLTMPLFPTYTSTITNLPEGNIGVFLNGVPIRRHTYVSTFVDRCNGDVDASGSYFVAGYPICLLEALGDTAGLESSIIGYALDGFPIYGPYGSDGLAVTDLDACNGKVGSDGFYRYHVTLTSPFTLGCFHGTVSVDEVQGIIIPSTYMRSLSYNHNIKINTTAPEVLKVYTTKISGTMVAGESLTVRVAFSQPVTVLHGTPYLELVTGSTDPRAIYTQSEDSDTVLLFEYTVSEDDDTSSINCGALILNGASILQKSTNPTTPAILTLASNLNEGLNVVDSMFVELRGLQKSHEAALSIDLLHRNEKGVLTLDNKNRLDSDVYFFGDIDDKNIASSGKAEQSSTDFGGIANRAIDGNRDGRYSQDSVTHTAGYRSPQESLYSKKSPWWQLKLKETSLVGTIKLWNREQESRKYEVQIIATSALVTIDGSFQLSYFTSDGITEVTDNVAHNAVAMKKDEDGGSTMTGTGAGESMESKLEALSNLGNIRVTRSGPFRLGEFAWTITFLSTAGNATPLAVHTNSITSTGSAITVSTIMDGNENTWYNYEGKESFITGRLFPCRVMLFDGSTSMAFESIDDAHKASIYSVLLDEEQRETTITLPARMKVAYVRIQLIHSANNLEDSFLSIAEVEVFAHRGQVLASREGMPNPLKQKWLPESSFEDSFAGSSMVGIWHLRIKLAENATPCSISDWVLHITNQNGEKTIGFMNLVGFVTTLPVHGTLVVPFSSNHPKYLDDDLDWYLNMDEVSNYLTSYRMDHQLLNTYEKSQTIRQAMDHYFEYAGLPLESETKQCIAQACPYRDKIHYYPIKNHRKLRYFPPKDYTGPDTFTYCIQQGEHDCITQGNIDIQVV